MDLKGSLVDTNLRVIASENLVNYLKTIDINGDVPDNIAKLINGTNKEPKCGDNKSLDSFSVQFTDKDIENLNKIKDIVGKTVSLEESEISEEVLKHSSIDEANKTDDPKNALNGKTVDKTNSDDMNNEKDNTKEIDFLSLEESEISEEVLKDSSIDEADKTDDPKNALNGKTNDETNSDDMNNEKDNTKEIDFLTTSDIDWLYKHLQNQRNKGVKDVPYLHKLLEDANIELPENKVIKRNPVLEARCVKLRAQQEAREYRKMTKTVDNVRMRFPEDSISYQMKQLNRQLIAVGQFLLSIFAGFLFGFRGIEWMVGYLDFGFRLLLGVMCALVIALAEIYFLAKKLNEELNIPETVQLGGPPKFANPPKSYDYDRPPSKTVCKEAPNKAVNKEHQD